MRRTEDFPQAWRYNRCWSRSSFRIEHDRAALSRELSAWDFRVFLLYDALGAAVWAGSGLKFSLLFRTGEVGGH